MLSVGVTDINQSGCPQNYPKFKIPSPTFRHSNQPSKKKWVSPKSTSPKSPEIKLRRPIHQVRKGTIVIETDDDGVRCGERVLSRTFVLRLKGFGA